MKATTKILIAVLIISGLMSLIACVFAAFNQPKLMEMFHLTSASTPDLQKTIVIMGAAMIASVLIQFLAAAWIWNGKGEGLTLSLWFSFILITVYSTSLPIGRVSNTPPSAIHVRYRQC